MGDLAAWSGRSSAARCSRRWLLVLLCAGRAIAAGHAGATVQEPCSVIHRQARFSVLTPRTIRLEHSATATFEDRPSIVFNQRNASVPLPPCANVATTGGLLTLRTTAGLELSFDTVAGERNFSRGIKLSFPAASGEGMWQPAADGLYSPAHNLNGSLEVMDCYSGWWSCIHLYQAKMQPGIVSRSGWAVVDDTDSVLFDGNTSRWPEGWRVPRPHQLPPREASDAASGQTDACKLGAPTYGTDAGGAALGCLQLDNTTACAIACCEHYDSSGQIDCGGYTWDPLEPNDSGKDCPMGKPACWLKVLGAKLGKGDARFASAVTGTPPAPVPPPVPPVASESNYSDWTVFAHGDDYRGALKDFRAVAGPIPLIPKRVLGVWYARYFPYSAAGLKEVAQGYADHGLPLDVLRIDMDWHLAAEHGNPEAPGCFHAGPGMNGGCAAGWGGYNWDRKLFPDPQDFAAWASSQNISTMLNVHDQCGVDMCQEGYAQAIANNDFPTLAANQTVDCRFESQAYAGLTQQLLSSSPDHAGIDWWWSDMGGVPDAQGNPQWQCGLDTPTTGFSSAPVPHLSRPPGLVQTLGFIYGGARTPAVLWGNYVRHATAIIGPKKRRGFRLGINGGIGSHRYPHVGSGDVEASWGMLSYIVHQTLVASNVALAWFHELGAFYAMPPFADCNAAAVAKSKQLGEIGCDHKLCLLPDPNGTIIPGGANDTSCVKTSELFTRWSQFSVFHSIYSGTVEGLENRPWKYPNSGSGYGPASIQQTILLRHALTLYHYTALRQAHLDGVTVSHPLYYDNPKEDVAYRFSDFELRDEENHCDQNSFKPTYHQSAECLQLRPKSVGYAWGLDFIVYPVTFWSNTSTGIALQDVWAPPGTHVHFQSGRSLKGPRVYTNESFAPESIPAYVKAGAVIPMQRFGSDATVLSVVLAEGGSGVVGTVVGELYEDDGTSLLHADGAFRLSNITHSSDEKGTRVVGVSRVAGDGYSGEPLRREWVVEFRQGATSLRPPTVVVANGEALQRSGAKRAPGWWIETGNNGADAGEGLARLVVAVGMVDAAASLSVVVRGLS